MTLAELDKRAVELQSIIANQLATAQKLQAGSVEFDEAYGGYLASKAELAKMPELKRQAQVAENKVAIDAAGKTVAEAIQKLIAGLKVSELLGEDVKTLRYYVEESGTVSVIFNPKAMLRPKGKAVKSGGRTIITDSEGNTTSVTKFVLAHATEAEKASKAFDYPHTQCDTEAKFQDFCVKHNLTGFTYSKPIAQEEPAPAPEAPVEAQS